jgi:hypothetical protein
MSRQTQSAVAKRIQLVQIMRHVIDHIDDDEQVRRICNAVFVLKGHRVEDLLRRIRNDVRAMNPDIDLDNPRYVRLLQAEMENHAVEILSNPARYSLPTGTGQSGARKQRKAEAKTVLRAFRMRLRQQGYRADDAWRDTASKAKEEYPDLFDGKSNEKIKKILTR